MSDFNGKIHLIGALKGRLKKQIVDLKAKVLRVHIFGASKITHIPAFGGEVQQKKFFGGAVNSFAALYRFLCAKVRILTRHSANASTVPASTISAANKIPTSTNATATAQPAQGIAANRRVRLSVRAHLVAYNRAAATYIKRILMSRKAVLIAADGAVAERKKAAPLKLTAKAETADSAIGESRKNIATVLDASPSYTPSTNIASETSFASQYTAAASSALTMPIRAARKIGTSHNVKLAYWIEPVVENGVLILRQAYGATQTDKKIEVV